MRATLVVNHRVNLIDNQRACRAEHSAAAIAGQQDVERLRGGDDDVRRLLRHRYAIFRRSVACAHQRANLNALDARGCEIFLNPAQRRLQIDLDIVAERFQW